MNETVNQNTSTLFGITLCSQGILPIFVRIKCELIQIKYKIWKLSTSFVYWRYTEYNINQSLFWYEKLKWNKKVLPIHAYAYIKAIFHRAKNRAIRIESTWKWRLLKCLSGDSTVIFHIINLKFVCKLFAIAYKTSRMSCVWMENACLFAYMLLICQ